MNIVPIVFSFDNNFILPACVCMSSLLMNAKKDTFYDIFILHSPNIELEKEQLDKLLVFYKNCRIQYRAVDDIFENSFEIRGITVATYYRLLIPEVIPEYDKIIYSDVDVIFRSDLFEIYMNTDLENAYVAGVNAMVPMIPDMNLYYSKLEKADPNNIIYAGNIILNSKKIREDKLTSKFIGFANKKFKFQDLDVLNIVCSGKIVYLEPEFCLTTYLNELFVKKRETVITHWSQIQIEKALSNGIIHYNGQKPWKGFCVNFDIWWEYYRKSPFFDEKFYFDFFYDKLNELDQLPLWKRIKILIRYFVYGKRTI